MEEALGASLRDRERLLLMYEALEEPYKYSHILNWVPASLYSATESLLADEAATAHSVFRLNPSVDLVSAIIKLRADPNVAILKRFPIKPRWLQTYFVQVANDPCLWYDPTDKFVPNNMVFMRAMLSVPSRPLSGKKTWRTSFRSKSRPSLLSLSNPDVPAGTCARTHLPSSDSDPSLPSTKHAEKKRGSRLSRKRNGSRHRSLSSQHSVASSSSSSSSSFAAAFSSGGSSARTSSTAYASTSTGRSTSTSTRTVFDPLIKVSLTSEQLEQLHRLIQNYEVESQRDEVPSTSSYNETPPLRRTPPSSPFTSNAPENRATGELPVLFVTKLTEYEEGRFSRRRGKVHTVVSRTQNYSQPAPDLTSAYQRPHLHEPQPAEQAAECAPSSRSVSESSVSAAAVAGDPSSSSSRALLSDPCSESETLSAALQDPSLSRDDEKESAETPSTFGNDRETPDKFKSESESKHEDGVDEADDVEVAEAEDGDVDEDANVDANADANVDANADPDRSSSDCVDTSDDGESDNNDNALSADEGESSLQCNERALLVESESNPLKPASTLGVAGNDPSKLSSNEPSKLTSHDPSKLNGSDPSKLTDGEQSSKGALTSVSPVAVDSVDQETRQLVSALWTGHDVLDLRTAFGGSGSGEDSLRLSRDSGPSRDSHGSSLACSTALSSSNSSPKDTEKEGKKKLQKKSARKLSTVKSERGNRSRTPKKRDNNKSISPASAGSPKSRSRTKISEPPAESTTGSSLTEQTPGLSHHGSGARISGGGGASLDFRKSVAFRAFFNDIITAGPQQQQQEEQRRNQHHLTLSESALLEPGQVTARPGRRLPAGGMTARIRFSSEAPPRLPLSQPSASSPPALGKLGSLDALSSKLSVSSGATDGITHRGCAPPVIQRGLRLEQARSLEASLRSSLDNFAKQLPAFGSTAKLASPRRAPRKRMMTAGETIITALRNSNRSADELEDIAPPLTVRALRQSSVSPLARVALEAVASRRSATLPVSASKAEQRVQIGATQSTPCSSEAAQYLPASPNRSGVRFSVTDVNGITLSSSTEVSSSDSSRLAIPPPPPPPSRDLPTRLNPLCWGNNSSDKYVELFGIVDRFTSGVFKWKIVNLKPEIDAAIYDESLTRPEREELERDLIDFYDGDCYLVVFIPSYEIPVIDVHYWIGENATIDKRAAVALRAIQLSTYLKGARHSRQEQGEESEDFLSIFPQPLNVLVGGSDPGLKHVSKTTWPRRMFHFSSHKGISFKAVPLEVSSLAQSGVFVLDDGLTLYVWCGSKSTTRQRFDCENLVRMLVTEERHSDATVIRLQERDEDPFDPLEAADERAFFCCLGAEQPLRSAALLHNQDGDQGEDCSQNVPWRVQLVDLGTLFRFQAKGVQPEYHPQESIVTALEEKPAAASLSSKSRMRRSTSFRRQNKLSGSRISRPTVRESVKAASSIVAKIQSVSVDKYLENVWDARSRKSLCKAVLLPDYCHVLEAGHDIYVWLRKGCNSTEYKVLMEAVELRKHRQNVSGMLFIEKAGLESVFFRARFTDWVQVISPALRLPCALVADPKLIPAQEQFDVALLKTLKPSDPAEMVDDVSGIMNVWRLFGTKPSCELLSDEEWGEFYTEDCYAVFYSYVKDKKQRFLVYFWSGSHANGRQMWPRFQLGFVPTLRESLALQHGRVSIDTVRVEQQNEPEHFLALFGRAVIYHQGSHDTQQETRLFKTCLYRLRQFTLGDLPCCCTLQVPVNSVLSAQDSYILSTEDTCYLWQGAADPQLDATALPYVGRKLMGQVEKYVVDLRDDENCPEFWDQVQKPRESTSGSPVTVAAADLSQSSSSSRLTKESALFRCGFAGDGKPDIVRLPRIIQSALEDVEAYLLETAHTLYVRMPLNPSDNLSALVKDISTRYAALQGITVRSFEAGQEPLAFQDLFVGWVSNQVFIDPRIAIEEEVRRRDLLELVARRQREQENKEQADEKNPTQLPDVAST